MGETPKLVTFELGQLEGTPQRYLLYRFKPKWRSEHLHAAFEEGRVALDQLPANEMLEVAFVFSEGEMFESVNLFAELRNIQSDPVNDRLHFTSIVVPGRLAREFLHGLVGVLSRHFLRNNQLIVGFYESFDEVLLAMRERFNDRQAPS